MFEDMSEEEKNGVKDACRHATCIALERSWRNGSRPSSFSLFFFKFAAWGGYLRVPAEAAIDVALLVSLGSAESNGEETCPFQYHLQCSAANISSYSPILLFLPRYPPSVDVIFYFPLSLSPSLLLLFSFWPSLTTPPPTFHSFFWRRRGDEQSSRKGSSLSVQNHDQLFKNPSSRLRDVTKESPQWMCSSPPGLRTLLDLVHTE